MSLISQALEEQRSWDQILSGGEQQRLAFARLLLQLPDIIVLDEAAAALDAPSQKRVMDMLAQEFRHATIGAPPTVTVCSSVITCCAIVETVAPASASEATVIISAVRDNFIVDLHPIITVAFP
jgi:ABC-type iron transport system FetAB ATPase subunit